jgi:hypothetical protein
LERLGFDVLFHRLPITGNYLRDVRGTFKKLMIGTGIATLTQNAQEHAQDAISAFGPGFYQALKRDAPEVDWDALQAKYLGSRPEVIMASTIFGLLSAGTIKFSDLKDPAHILNDEILSQTGMKSRGRDRFFFAPESQKEQVLREELAKITPADIKRANGRVEYQNERAMRNELDPNMPTRTSTVDELTGERTWTVNRNETGELSAAGQKKVNDYQSLIDCLGRGTE